MLLLNSQELVRACGLAPGRADECECAQSLSSLQLFCVALVCALGTKADKGLASLHAAASARVRIWAGGWFWWLSTLLAPVSPSCKDSAHFSCGISHACKCLCQGGHLVTLGRLHSWTVACAKGKEWTAGWLQPRNSKERGRAHWAVFVCLWVAFYLVPVSGHSACSSFPNQYFQLILTVWAVDFVWLVAWFLLLTFYLLLYFGEKIQLLISLTSETPFWEGLSYSLLFLPLGLGVKPHAHATVVHLTIPSFNCGL